VKEGLVVLGVFIFVGVVLSLVAAHIRAGIRHRTEVQKALIAKFSSTQELAEFLNSDAGRILFEGMKNPPAMTAKDVPPRSFKEQVGITISWGVLGLCAGGAIFAVYGITLPASLFVALGLGFIFNALLRVLLSKTWT
jgi:hypothetical protein